MLRRRATIALHWSLLILTIMLVGGITAPGVSWAFALAGLSMTGLAMVFGLQSRPGPALSDILRALHRWGHRVFYAYLALVSACTALGQITALPVDLHLLYLILIWTAVFHGMFHLWRHTSLGDGALRTMTPRAWHGLL